MTVTSRVSPRDSQERNFPGNSVISREHNSREIFFRESRERVYFFILRGVDLLVLGDYWFL